MRIRTSTRWRVAPILVAAALAAAACGSSSDTGTGSGSGGTGTGGSAEPVSGDVAGEVTILHAFTGAEDLAGLRSVITAFNVEYPNVTVKEEGSNNFESLARTRIGGGQAPSVVLHPQPGLLEDFVNQGVVKPLDYLDREALSKDLLPGLLDYTTFDDTLFAIPLRLSMKSLVWYNKPLFDSAGYEIPKTQDELLALTEQVASDGKVKPWCIGIESGDATGWVATDWTEDLILRNLGGEKYDQWVAGDLAFDSDEVRGTIEKYMAPIWTNDANVFGGRAQISREAFGTSVNGIIGDSPTCLMHRQATFIEGFIKEANPTAEFGKDYDFFYYPQVNGDIGSPALTAGDLAAAYRDDDATKAFMQFLATPEAGTDWAKLGAYLSPFTNFDASNYPTDSARNAATILADADFVRFDGSDLMPSDVGSSSQDGSFWNEMTKWVEGQPLDQSLQAIDSLYDSVK